MELFKVGLSVAIVFFLIGLIPAYQFATKKRTTSPHFHAQYAVFVGVYLGLTVLGLVFDGLLSIILGLLLYAAGGFALPTLLWYAWTEYLEQKPEPPKSTELVVAPPPQVDPVEKRIVEILKENKK